MYHLECVVPSGSKSPVPRGQWTCTVCKSSSKVLSSTSALGGITTDGSLIETFDDRLLVFFYKTREYENCCQQSKTFATRIKESIDFLVGRMGSKWGRCPE
ncbi:unnamed protein product [Leptidea sinapis]|uniref:PHD-type domain-containing protein n=1 Tax=Leptidea sinapis TaxID=189913 RepID=A0A5E4Q6N4_9NEOP|nr:unnamed protein product [Leptidea sinapis]